jgi:hypothetical protein
MNLIRTEIAADLRKLADEIENSDADKIVHYVRLLSHDVLIPGTPVVGDRAGGRDYDQCSRLAGAQGAFGPCL